MASVSRLAQIFGMVRRKLATKSLPTFEAGLLNRLLGRRRGVKTEMPALEMTGFPVEPGRVIWRYMALERLQSILESRSLYFASAREFEDQYEGSITRPQYKRHLRAISGFGSELGLVDARVSRAFRELTRLTKVNCWHQSESESAAMWRLYLPEGKGVAVRSTVGDLMASVGEFRLKPTYGTETVYVGRVKYLDYRTQKMPDGSMLGRFFYKRASYSYESEVRAVLSLRMAEEFGVSVPEKGVFVPVDPGQLIHEVRVAPRLDDAFVEAVRRAVKQGDVAASVLRSEMDDPVLY